MKKTLPLAASLLLLAACAAQNYNPVIDTKGVNMAKYQQDLSECRALAAQVDGNTDTATDALVGAGVGAAGGAALGAITGSAGIGAATGAVVGAFGGGGYGALNSNERQKNILNNCLKGRGYRILG